MNEPGETFRQDRPTAQSMRLIRSISTHTPAPPQQPPPPPLVTKPFHFSLHPRQRLQEIPHDGPFCDMMWSDPEEIAEPWVISPRGAGYLFGSKVTREFNHVRVLASLTRFPLFHCLACVRPFVSIHGRMPSVDWGETTSRRGRCILLSSHISLSPSFQWPSPPHTNTPPLATSQNQTHKRR